MRQQRLFDALLRWEEAATQLRPPHAKKRRPSKRDPSPLRYPEGALQAAAEAIDATQALLADPTLAPGELLSDSAWGRPPVLAYTPPELADRWNEATQQVNQLRDALQPRGCVLSDHWLESCAESAKVLRALTDLPIEEWGLWPWQRRELHQALSLSAVLPPEGRGESKWQSVLVDGEWVPKKVPFFSPQVAEDLARALKPLEPDPNILVTLAEEFVKDAVADEEGVYQMAELMEELYTLYTAIEWPEETLAAVRGVLGGCDYDISESVEEHQGERARMFLEDETWGALEQLTEL